MFKEIFLERKMEKNLLIKYSDKAAERYLDREKFEEDKAILLRTKKTGTISEEDYNSLYEEARELLPKKLLIKNEN
jgi:hypothetical protein